jgi:hypothetical protein
VALDHLLGYPPGPRRQALMVEAGGRAWALLVDQSGDSFRGGQPFPLSELTSGGRRCLQQAVLLEGEIVCLLELDELLGRLEQLRPDTAATMMTHSQGG